MVLFIFHIPNGLTILSGGPDSGGVRIVYKTIVRLFLSCFLLALLLGSFAGGLMPAQLRADEAASAGWKVLFDGKTTVHWRGFRKASFPDKGWVVEGGCLLHRKNGGGGDLVTREFYEDFEFEFEWKLGSGANSGIKYLISEERDQAIGIEYQLWDEGGQRPAGKQSTGAAYDLLPPKTATPMLSGKFNQSRILLQGKHVEHWLNGIKVLEFDLESPELTAAIAKSKFKTVVGFGTKARTPILIQDHGGEVWFRNLRIRELPKTVK
jgi:hypothetical protein